MLMKSLSPQYPTSLGHVEALELKSARTYTFSYGMSEHQIKQQQNHPHLTHKDKAFMQKIM